MHPRTEPLANRYRLTSLIAGGGMGEVWRGHDTLLDRPVAVKVLRDQYAGDATFRARFRAEAQHAALLTHPHIAAVFDYGDVRVDERGGVLRLRTEPGAEGRVRREVVAQHLDRDRAVQQGVAPAPELAHAPAGDQRGQQRRSPPARCSSAVRCPG